jgi:exosome complex component RRP4
MKEKSEHERIIATPGEIIASGNEYLPGEGTEKIGEDIFAQRYGLAEISERLVKVIPLSGTYIPRRGNIVVGEVIDISFNGWIIDINAPVNGFLSLMECPRYIHKDELSEFLDIGDILVAKIVNAKPKSIDLTLKGRGLGNIEEGIVIKINPHKVPRVIGKEGSMIQMIQQETGCECIVGQNGFIWISGKSIDDELLAKRAIFYVAEHSIIEGLTEKLKAWLDEEKERL